MKTLAPSHANAWVLCPAFIPNRFISDSDSAREGVAAAWVADTVLKSDEGISALDFEGETAPNGHDIDLEMVKHIQDYVDYIIKESNGRGFTSEQYYSDVETGITGRLDTEINQQSNVLHIIDLKYGYKIVEPWDNWQFIAYGFLALKPHITGLKFTVYQPRPYHPEGPIRTMYYHRDQFEKRVKHLKEAAAAAQELLPVQNPGNACGRCANRHHCPALSANVYAGYEHITGNTEMYEMKPAELSAEFDFISNLLKMIQDKHTGLEMEIESRLANGEFIPNYYNTKRLSNWYFPQKPEVLKALTGCDPYKPRTLKTPADMKKEGVSEHIIDALKRRRVNGTKVTKHDPKRTERLFKK